MPRRLRLAQRRKSVGHSQERLAERLGVERSTIVRWESGETDPQPWLRPKLARALQVSVERLEDLLGSGGHSDEEDPERLAFALRHPGSADLLTVAHLRDTVRRLDERYDSAQSACLLAEAGQCLGRVSFLGGYISSGRVRRELCRVECEAATLMGQLIWDASQRHDHISAYTYFDQAIDAARRLSDPAAEGAALLRKSYVTLYGEHDPEAGLALTQHTARVVRHRSEVLTGLALLHSAEAHAMLGRRSRCEQALSDAETHIGRHDTDDVAIELYSESQLGRLAGSCYLFLSDAGRAAPILERTADRLRDRSKSRAIVLGNLALARIRGGNLDAAVAALNAAIDAVEVTRGGGGLNVVSNAGRELRPWQQERCVHDVYDRLLTLMAA